MGAGEHSLGRQLSAADCSARCRCRLQLDALSGSLLWKFNTNGSVESHPAYHDGVVYVSAEESRTLYALDAARGVELWR